MMGAQLLIPVDRELAYASLLLLLLGVGGAWAYRRHRQRGTSPDFSLLPGSEETKAWVQRSAPIAFVAMMVTGIGLFGGYLLQSHHPAVANVLTVTASIAFFAGLPIMWLRSGDG